MIKRIRRIGKKDLYQYTGRNDEEILLTAFEGGLAFPGTSPAFVCIVGLEEETCVLHVLEEFYEEKIIDLARKIATTTRLYEVRRWVADLNSKVNKKYEEQLYDIFRSQNNKICPVWQTDLPNDFNQWIQIIEAELQQNALTVSRDGILQSRLEQVKELNPRDPGLWKDYPEIGALAAVIDQFYFFGKRKQRWEAENRPKDPYAEGFEDVEGGSWMSEL